MRGAMKDEFCLYSSSYHDFTAAHYLPLRSLGGARRAHFLDKTLRLWLLNKDLCLFV